MKIVNPSASLEWITPNALNVIESAGRTCYKSEDKITVDSSSDFVQKIIKRGHEAVIEHASASFRIVCDRAISHEIVRHRIASYCQESTRYCRYESEIIVIKPHGLNLENRNRWESLCLYSENVYLNMIYDGVSPQNERAVLPSCLKTELVMTANFREWRHFLKLRLDEAAHPQIRFIAGKIRNRLKKECVEVFGDL